MDNVEWPSQPIPQQIKNLIARFYKLVDTSTHDTSRELADTVFTEDSTFTVNRRVMAGRDGGDATQAQRLVISVLMLPQRSRSFEVAAVVRRP
ncbi:hypothetical protein BAUCODRAFT_453290 [Baudoinia panamericana UAMH 10762]|uniref:SnoaL-like domain-containing protein n=1 Tax=Baudoinia panamericana (strain UAMH 10762) TaxID=717646 RepID=M2NE29_BAUPA|nr:uncharacterized protein BAUCODRAFT_453290 [Baudoinia panamericana UAMH 10762]EMC97469.1 hypothetical protein BAUCODRAFT_453290 [Baudoinia panamericana UAMH 10762]